MECTYFPLNVDRREIRLLDVHPPEDDEAGLIRATLVHTTLEMIQDRFAALSYHWGCPDLTRTILLDGEPFPITENLEVALRAVRYEENSRLRLWVDAICIDQQNLNERKEQVKLMQDIYSQTFRVIAWIGPETEEVGRAFKFATDVATRSASESRPQKMTTSLDTIKWINLIISEAWEESGLSCLSKVLQRPWFSRVWVVQEVVMAKKVALYCGSKFLPWDTLFHTLEFLDRYTFAFEQAWERKGWKEIEKTLNGGSAENRCVDNKPLLKLFETLRKPRMTAKHRVKRISLEMSPLQRVVEYLSGFGITPDSLDQAQLSVALRTAAKSFLSESQISAMDIEGIAETTAKTISSESKPTERIAISLYQSMRRYQSFESSDPRDKIYALLGIATRVDNVRTVIEPDYSISALDAYWNLVTLELDEYKTLEFLSGAWGVNRPESWPSWMPLLGAPSNRLSELRILAACPELEYHASKQTKPQYHLVRKELKLELGGVLIGNVEKLGPVCENREGSFLDGKPYSNKEVTTHWARMLGILDAIRQTHEYTPCQMKEYVDRLNRGEFTETDVAMFNFETTTLMTPRYITPSQLFGMVKSTLSSDFGIGEIENIFKATTDAGSVCSSASSFVDRRKRGACHGRRLFITDNGWSGLCPSDTASGDIVVLFLGAKVPFILRPVARDASESDFVLVGEAFVCGAMTGEIEEWRQRLLADGIDKLRTFPLV